VIEGIKGLVITLAAIAILLLIYGAQLPQYGDGAIGTFMVFVASFAAYVLLLIIAAPMAVRSYRRGETLAQAGWLCGAIAAPIATWLAVIFWGSRA